MTSFNRARWTYMGTELDYAPALDKIQHSEDRYLFVDPRAIWDTKSLLWRIARARRGPIVFTEQTGRDRGPEVVLFDGRRTTRAFYRLRKRYGYGT